MFPQEDRDLGFWAEEAHLCFQDPGLSEETHKDTEEGRKLPKEAKEKVDSK